MLMSTDRILVSHVGSLPRSTVLSELLIRQEAGETIDTAELARQVEAATADVIRNRSKPALTWAMTVSNRGSDFRPMFLDVSVALAASPNVRQQGIKSSSQAMPVRWHCAFRALRA